MLPTVTTGTKWVVAQALVLGLIAMAVISMGGEATPPTTITAILLFVAGQAMAIAAALQMGQYISAHPAPAPGASLLQHGIFRLVRHPMYGGVMLMATAIAIFDVNPAALVLTGVLAAVFHGKSRYEESLLAATFLGYEEYRKRVTRRFIPWIV
jgi:protein-S-isoprenylcysteine O-methyltransferase Ste14